MTKLDNDFERMIPEYHEGMLLYGEHILRYESVTDIVKNKTVLDIASGSGYGSAILAMHAKKVFGVDINKKAVAYSKEKYHATNAEFLVGGGNDIPIENNSVDVVISHETIEHIDDYRGFLKEIKRVLKNDGQAVISTPNDDEYPTGNHFHLHQFKINEYVTLLKNYFKNVELYYQDVWISAILLNKADFTNTWTQQVTTFKTRPQTLNKAPYLVAICSDKKVSKLKSLAALTEHWSDKEQRELTTLRNNKEKELKDQINDRDKSLNLYLKHIKDLEAQINDIKNSKSWKYTQFLRSINRYL